VAPRKRDSPVDGASTQVSDRSSLVH